MAVVLTQNEATESGHAYRDVFGVSYEYPTIYRHLVLEGECFVYYRGRRRAAGGLQPQAYLGIGIVGEVRQKAGLLTCTFAAFAPFPRPVYFKDATGYIERDAHRYGPKAGLYFRRGVREIDQETFRRIVRLGREAASASSE